MTWQQFNNAERLISARKLKEIRTIGEGRGRKLKTADLTTILLYAFGEYDAEEDEAYPRLTTGTLYRAMDNVTTMKAARDIILSLGPSSFKISLSFCYNYTGRPSSFKISLSFCYNYTGRQAIQHHHGREVNAPISLKVILKAHVWFFSACTHSAKFHLLWYSASRQHSEKFYNFLDGQVFNNYLLHDCKLWFPGMSFN